MAYDYMYDQEDDPFAERRSRLVQLMKGRGGGGRRSLSGARPLFGGLGRGVHSSLDFPAGALPNITFDPFQAQQDAGFSNLAAPTPHGAPPPQAAPGGGGSFYGQEQRSNVVGSNVAPPRRFLGDADPNQGPDIYAPEQAPTPSISRFIRLIRGF